MVESRHTCIPPTRISSEGFIIKFSIVTPWAVATSWMPRCAIVLAAIASSLVPISSITITWGMWFSTASINTWLAHGLNNDYFTSMNSKSTLRTTTNICYVYEGHPWQLVICKYFFQYQTPIISDVRDNLQSWMYKMNRKAQMPWKIWKITYHECSIIERISWMLNSMQKLSAQLWRVDVVFPSYSFERSHLIAWLGTLKI